MSIQNSTLLPWLAAGLAVGTAACYQGPVTRRYTVPTSKLVAGSRLRLAVLSDLHGTRFGDGQRQLTQRVSRERPDYILLPGDLFDERFPPDTAVELLRGLAPIAAVYYAPGNHEYRTHRMGKVLEMVDQCGAKALLDRCVRLETHGGPLLLCGCEDMEKRRFYPGYKPKESLRHTFSGIWDSRCYTVLLGHRPERIGQYRALGFDLVVSGHAHGGQWRVPWLLNGVYAPDQGLFPPYAGGLYRHGATRHVVSRGLAVYPGLPRIWNPPEITVVDVVGQ